MSRKALAGVSRVRRNRHVRGAIDLCNLIDSLTCECSGAKNALSIFANCDILALRSDSWPHEAHPCQLETLI